MKRLLFLFFLFSALSLSLTAQTAAKEISAAGLSSQVTIRRDDRSIPYIEAKSDADLYFAQGYATASDRLWQMDLLRRVARGETAEIFGSQALEEDKRWRRYGFAEIANQSVEQMNPQMREALNNYARGVNAYIATLTDKTMPVEFRTLQYKPRQWTSADSIVVGKVLADGLSSTFRTDLLRVSLQQTLSKDKFADITNTVTPYDVVLFGKDKGGDLSGSEGAVNETVTLPTGRVSASLLAAADKDEQMRASSLSRVGLYAEELAASNNFVISGTRTADGKPILENDPHLAPTAPGIWYLSHLSTGAMRVSGVTIPGFPGIVVGHNTSFAWGVTNVGPDVQDVYYETFNDQGDYKTPTGWEKPVVRHEIINVRSNPLKPETTPVTLDVTETRNGVIVLEDGGKKYAMKWTARDPKNNEGEAFFIANRAKNWEQFKAALRSYGGPTQNFIYADVKGNIGWYAAGRIPTRKTGDGSLPYDGSTNDGEWTGYIPFEELPNLYNPPSGLIVTANQRIVGTTYKYQQMTRTYTSWRARRIKDQLEAKTKITMDDARDVLYDSYDIPLANFAKEVVKLGAASNETLDLLKSWDGRLAADSRGALIANGIRSCVAGKMADDNKLAQPLLISARIIDWAVREQTPRWLPAGFANYTELLKSCDASTRTSFAGSNRYGPDPTKWVWGQIFKSRFPHPLAVAPLIGAQFATPSVPIDGSNASESPNVGSNVSMRYITSPGNWDLTRHVIPLGQSGDPQSPHFKDQFEAWRTGTTMIFPFSRAAVEKAATEIVVMNPK